MSERGKKEAAWLKFPIWLQALICNKGQPRTHPLLYLQTWILRMEVPKGLINTSCYFGVGQESQSSIAQGNGGAAFCVHRVLQGKYGVASTDQCFAAPNRGTVKPCCTVRGN